MEKNSQLLLTIDTSTTACSAAITRNGLILGEYLVDTGKTLSRHLLGAIAGMAADCGITVDKLDGIGVALGPGSFTGLRVGVATAKGLALAVNKPVAGFSSLAMLAMNLPWSAHPVCPMLDARKNEVYAALYECRDFPAAILKDCVLPPADFLEQITGTTIFVGSGAIRYRGLIESVLGERAIFAPGCCNQPRASAGALLACRAIEKGETTPLALLNPFYIRPSEAELKKKSNCG